MTARRPKRLSPSTGLSAAKIVTRFRRRNAARCASLIRCFPSRQRRHTWRAPKKNHRAGYPSWERAGMAAKRATRSSGPITQSQSNTVTRRRRNNRDAPSLGAPPTRLYRTRSTRSRRAKSCGGPAQTVTRTRPCASNDQQSFAAKHGKESHETVNVALPHATPALTPSERHIVYQTTSSVRSEPVPSSSSAAKPICVCRGAIGSVPPQPAG